MNVTPLSIVFVVLSFIVLCIGQEPSKWWSKFAVVLIVAAVGAHFAQGLDLHLPQLLVTR